MRTNVQLNLTQAMYTSRHASNCSAVDSRTGSLLRPALHPCLKMFILKHTKPRAPLVHQVLNGEPLLHHLRLQGLPSVRLLMDGVDLLRSILHLILPTHTTKETVARLHLRHVRQVRDSQNR